MEPVISIAMTCFNQGHFIRDAIKSVVKQSVDNWQLNIVDDCSTDNSLEVIRRILYEFNIEDKTVILRHEKNMGYGTSLGDAIMMADAPLVVVIDSDDALADKEAFNLSIKAHNKNSDVVLTYSNYVECDEKLKRKSTFKTRQLKASETYMTAGVRVSHLKVFKKAAYLKTEGINPELKQTVDKDLVLKLEEVGKFLYINKNLLLYRHHENNLSRSIHKKDKKYRKFVERMRIKTFESAKKRRGIK